MAWAFSAQKPVLYFLPKGQVIDPALKIFQDGRRAGKVFKVRYYAEGKLKENILQGLEALALAFKSKEKQLADIKFTLRITSRIERFVNWKAKRRKMTKANFMRFFLTQMMEEDCGFQNYLNKKDAKR